MLSRSVWIRPYLARRAETRDPRPAQRLDEALREGKPHVGAVEDDGLEPLALEKAGEPAHRGFDFGKFGHGAGALAACSHSVIAKRDRRG